MKPIVFLDFDGVVMTAESYASAAEDVAKLQRGPNEDTWLAKVAYHRLDPALVANVQKLCELRGADVVLSTAWRPHDVSERPKLVSALRRRGLKAKVVGQTPRLYPKPRRFGDHELPRGAEIRAWLDRWRKGWRSDDIIILDDDPDVMLAHKCSRPDGSIFYGFAEWAANQWVETSFEGGGFNDERLEYAKRNWGNFRRTTRGVAP